MKVTAPSNEVFPWQGLNTFIQKYDRLFRSGTRTRFQLTIEDERKPGELQRVDIEFFNPGNKKSIIVHGSTKEHNIIDSQLELTPEKQRGKIELPALKSTVDLGSKKPTIHIVDRAEPNVVDDILSTTSHSLATFWRVIECFIDEVDYVKQAIQDLLSKHYAPK